MSGRAGRPQFEDSGVVIIMTKKDSVSIQVVVSFLIICSMAVVNATDEVVPYSAWNIQCEGFLGEISGLYIG